MVLQDSVPEKARLEETATFEAVQTSENVPDVLEQQEQSDDVVQSIEVELPTPCKTQNVNTLQEPRGMARRPTIDSADGNEPDDDIEINVGADYDPSNIPQIDPTKKSPVDDGEQRFYEKPRKNSTMQQKQDPYMDNSFNNNNYDDISNFDQSQMPPEAQALAMQFQTWMGNNGMYPQNMRELTQCYTQYFCYQFRTVSNGPLANNSNDFMQMQQQQMNFMMQTAMQMGIPPQMVMPMMAGMNGSNANWSNNMMPQGFPNMVTQPFMGNSASFNQQQYSQFPNGDSRSYNKHGYFPGRGRGRKAGRGGRGGYNNQQFQQDPFFGTNNFNFGNNVPPFHNQYDQNSAPYSQKSFNGRTQDEQTTNTDKDYDQNADDDEFAPGGQEEIREALGDSYEKKPSPSPPELDVEVSAPEDTKEATVEATNINDKEPMPEQAEPAPKHDIKEEDIPEAYREDLDMAMVPPSAPSGPSAKDVPFRARGHGRFPSRGRGSFHGANGYTPHSPARTISQTYTHSPPSNQGTGVVGAPTGPRAMREKDLSAPKTATRSESDGGFKIRGTASLAKPREEPARSATPRSTYDDYDDRDDRNSSHRYARHDRKHESSSRRYDQPDEYDGDRDRKRRKSRREDDYHDDHEMQDAEPTYPLVRSDSQDHDRGTSYRSGRKEREREKTKEKYPSSTSKHKSSSRKYEQEDTHEDYNGTNEHVDEQTSKSSRPSKKSSRYDERDDRRERDNERAERDKHRKRSRHDREREDGYEDADDEEARRRSRKHKKEHVSSSGRKDRDRERDKGGRDREDREHDDVDLGMRISGRSATHRTSEAVQLAEPVVDKDPHTLEREARNRERMLKEQQRRENAAKAGSGTLSGGRTRSFKYEDDIERSLAKASRRR